MQTVPGWKHAARKAIGYLYVALWDRKYAFKRLLANRAVPIAVFILSALEIGGALFHVASFSRVLPHAWELSTSVALAIVALLLVWRHHSQEKRIKKSEAILVALRAAFIENPRGEADEAGEHAKAVAQFMHDILTKIVFALEAKPTESKMHATILLQERRNDRFRIFDQFPSGMFPVDEISLDPNISSAAICFSGEVNTVLYIPMPRFLHGIKMSFVNAPHTDATSVEIVENAFENAGRAKSRQILGSFACIQIPKRGRHSGRLFQQLGVEPSSELILCLGCSSEDALGALEFNVLLVTANLLGMVLE